MITTISDLHVVSLDSGSNSRILPTTYIRLISEKCARTVLSFGVRAQSYRVHANLLLNIMSMSVCALFSTSVRSV